MEGRGKEGIGKSGRRWCPICGAELAEGKCPKHGAMRAFLVVDPLAAAAVAEHCDRIGIIDVEAAC